MKSVANIVKAWTLQSTLLEFYRYTPQKPKKLPAHCHGEYQFCLSVNYPSEYDYRKSIHFVPVGSVSIVHPGEMHGGTGRDIGNGNVPAIFRLMYVKPEVVHQILEGVSEQPATLPFFANSIILDTAIAHSFLQFHQASQQGASQLAQDEKLQSFLMALTQKYAEFSPTLKTLGNERMAVRNVRDYLNEHYADNVTLKQLAQIANLSPSYFSRIFKAEVGVSLPHYQTQVRINRARALLAVGMPIKKVAAATGFVDQSHLTYHFKRFTQVTPGGYRQKDRKNLQDFWET